MRWPTTFTRPVDAFSTKPKCLRINRLRFELFVVGVYQRDVTMNGNASQPSPVTSTSKS